MIPGMMSGLQGVASDRTLISAIRAAGLTSGLQICLDAGDGNSYTGSGQKWLDTSGNGYDFFRGDDANAESNDPTFNGSAGGQSSSEYWSFDGGDFFILDEANPSWVNDLHKNNAAVSCCAWVYPIEGAGPNQPLFSTWSETAETGVRLYWAPNVNGSLNFIVRNAGSTVLGVGSSAEALLMTFGQWNYVGFSFNEATGAVVWQVNTGQASESGTYSSPSTGSASRTLGIGTLSDEFFLSGVRLAKEAIWSQAIGASALDAIFQATRAPYGV